MLPYFYGADEYIKAAFGHKLYKLPLSSGCGCPGQGCAFCAGGGSALPVEGEDIAAQYAASAARLKGKFGGRGYIAYFGQFTNTYGDPARLEPLFRAALMLPGVEALSVATRPDCLPPDILAMLAQLARIKPLWIELGLQTADESVANSFGRGFDNDSYLSAVSALKGIGAYVITHLILGLPGATVESEEAAARFVCAAGTDGVKLTELYLVRNSRWESAPIETLPLEAYAARVGRVIENLSASVAVHRLTGDPPRQALIAPAWSADKRAAGNYIRNYLRRNNIRQGGAG